MKEFYRSIRDVDIPSCFKLAIITRACVVLKSRRKSAQRGLETRRRKILKLMACITSGFFITATGKLFIGTGRNGKKFEMVQLNRYVSSKVLAPNVVKLRSLTITAEKLIIAYSVRIGVKGGQEHVKMPWSEDANVRKQRLAVIGVDRNEKNLTYGNRDWCGQEDLSDIVKIKKTTREIVASFKRDDVRIRRKLSRKYWKRANDRTGQILHHAVNRIIAHAKSCGTAIALEDLRGINKMYQKGNEKGRDYRFRMNQWAHWKSYLMLDYKAAMKAVTIIKLTRAETRGSSSIHFVCGEKLRKPARDDITHRRFLWCPRCNVWVHRDINAVGNL